MQDQLGHVTVAPEVIMEIVRQTALATKGVARLDSLHPRGVRRLTGKSAEGIALDIQANTVAIDLHIVAEPTAQMLDLGRALQSEISRAIQDILGMPVRAIHVHIEDVADRFAQT